MLNDEPCHNSNTAFQVLFETYRRRVYAYVLAISHSNCVAEDLTQEVFIKLWLCRDILHEIDNPEAYIFAIARNKTLNHFRKIAHDNKLLNDLKNMLHQQNNGADERVTAYEHDKLLQEALTRLSPQRRLVYNLSRGQGLNHEQIAAHLQLSRNTVKNHLVEALRFIRSYFRVNGATIGMLIMLIF